MKFNFKPNVTVTSSEPDYDLITGGIRPEELLADDNQVVEVCKAINTLRNFIDEAAAAEVIKFF